MTPKLIVGSLVAVAIIAVGGYFFPSVAATLGATGTRFPNGLSTNSTSPAVGQLLTTLLSVSGASTLSGALTVATTTTTGPLTVGGEVMSTTSVGAGTFTQADLYARNMIVWSGVIGGAVVTLTLPASSTLDAFIPTAGQTRSIYFVNNGDSLVTFAGGVGTLLNIASTTSGPGTTGSNAKTVFANGVARIDFMRATSTDVEVILSPARQ